jgi:hypothetical protein
MTTQSANDFGNLGKKKVDICMEITREDSSE